jgi:zinc/manganese transport system substrate-binding protein
MKRSLTVSIAVVAVLVVVGAAVAVDYEYFTSSNACAGVNLGPGFNSSVAQPTPVAATSSIVAKFTPTALAAGAQDAKGSSATPSNSSFVIPVVAAENVWGDLLDQIGGSYTSVTSIITDPNTDPHEYQSNDSDSVAIAQAHYIVINNVGYDDWATQLVSADGASNQTILNLGDYLGVEVTGGIVTGNPHLWYNPSYVHDAMIWMTDNLTSIEPSLAGYFMNNYNALNASVNQNFSEIQTIENDFAGTKVAATESIFVYLANATGLDLVSPTAFTEAIAEGNDPPDQSIVQFQCQLESGQVKVLVFNAQTVTPITTSMKTIAAENNVSITYVTESVVPPFTDGQPTLEQVWFHSQLEYLYIALDAGQLGV